MKPQTPKHDLAAAYGIVSEELLHNDRLRSAVSTVLTAQLEVEADKYRDKFDLSERADVAARREAFSLGVEAGFGIVNNELLDSKTIKTRIENATIETTKEEQESV